MSLVFGALKDNNLLLLDKLLTDGQDVDTQDLRSRQTVLHKACQDSKPEAVKIILKHQPQINVQDRFGRTALHFSSDKGDLDSVVLLLENGANVNIGDVRKQTPLYLATDNNHLDIVKLLLNHGADPNIVTSNDDLPLHKARSCEGVQLLVDRGLNIHATNKFGNTPLSTASIRGSLSVVQSLCDLGADINHRDDLGFTPLHWASDQYQPSTVKYLVSQQPSINLVNNDNLTALDIARKKGYQEIVDIITAYTENIKGRDFSLPITDQSAEEGDQVEIKCETKAAVDKVTWLKDSVPPDYHITASSTGQEHRLVIESAYPTDEGTYTCRLDNGDETSGKLIVKALFSDSHSKVWSESERRHMVHTCVGKIMTAGMFESGKTSIARSLLKGQACLCRLNDRTVVINYTTWQISDDHTVPIVDIGGHECYSQVAHFFHCNDKSNIVLLIHDIKLVKDSDYDATFTWMRDIYTHSPRCTILPVLTKCDEISKPEVEMKKKDFAVYMTKCIENELKGLEKCEYSKESPTISRKKVKVLTKVLKAMKKRMHDRNIHVVSCKENIGLNILKAEIIKICRENQTSLPEKCYKLYQHIGLIGASTPTNKPKDAVLVYQRVKDMVLENPKSATTSEVLETQTDLTPMESEATPGSDKDSSDEETNPEHAEHSLNYKLIDKIYHEYYAPVNNEDPTEDLWNEFSSYMSFLHSRGLLLWFENLPQAKKIVFHDLNSFVLLLKTIFNHNIRQDLDYDKLTPAQKRLVRSRKRLKDHIKNLETKGELSEVLLKILLEKVGFQEHLGTVTDLLNKLNISTPMGESGSLYVPWFSQSTSQPDGLMTKIEKTKCCSSNIFALSTFLDGYIPVSLFHHLCLFVYKFLGNVDRQLVYLWKDNMWTETGNLNIHLCYKNSHEVCMNTACSLDDQKRQKSIKNMWQLIQNLQKESNNLKEGTWPGFINETIVFCAHCIIRKEVEPEEILVEETFKEYPVGGKCFCPKERGVKLPAALFYPLPEDSDLAEQGVRDLVTYLKREARTLEVEERLDNNQLEFDNKDTIIITQQVAQVVTRDVEQMLTQQTQAITQQMVTLVEGMSKGFNQMADQHRGLAQGIARQGFITLIQSDDASRLPLTCKHPVLLKNQEMLQDNLNVDSELLKLLSDRGLITVDDRKSIEKDRTHLGKVKRVLFLLERQQPVKVKEFVEVMYQCESDPNHELALHLGDSYDEFEKFQQQM